MRFDKIEPEYEGRVRLVELPFPLEVYGGGPPKRSVLDQEWWLAAIQEPSADFKPYNNPNWPTTTLPAFEAVWCARQQDEEAARTLDRRIRHAFFAESTDIGQRDIYSDFAREVGLEMPGFNRLFESDRPRQAVLEQGRIGKEQYNVRGTPTIMLGDGRKLRHPIAFPKMVDDRIVSVAPLPCCGEGCDSAVRGLFESALAKKREAF